MTGNIGQGLAAETEAAALVLEVDKIAGIFQKRNKVPVQFSYFFIGQLARGDVLFHTDKMLQYAMIVEHRRNRGQFPEQRAILAAIMELALPGAAGGDCSPHVAIFFRRLFPGTQHLRIPADDFGGAVASGRLELRIDVLNHRIRVSDDDGNRALLHRQRQRAQRLLGKFARPRSALEAQEIHADQRQGGKQDGTDRKQCLDGLLTPSCQALGLVQMHSQHEGVSAGSTKGSKTA
jgi:hypothetical protein